MSLSRQETKLVILNPTSGGLPAGCEFKKRLKKGGRARFQDIKFSKIGPNNFSVSGPANIEIEYVVKWSDHTPVTNRVNLSSTPVEIPYHTALLHTTNRQYEVRVGT